MKTPCFYLHNWNFTFRQIEFWNFIHFYNLHVRPVKAQISLRIHVTDLSRRWVQVTVPRMWCTKTLYYYSIYLLFASQSDVAKNVFIFTECRKYINLCLASHRSDICKPCRPRSERGVWSLSILFALKYMHFYKNTVLIKTNQTSLPLEIDPS